MPTITAEPEVSAPPDFAPWQGRWSPVLFGVEHENNRGWRGTEDDDEYVCDCDDEDCEDRHDPTPSIKGYDHPERIQAHEAEARKRGYWTAPIIPDDWRQHDEHCGWEIKTPPTRDISHTMNVFRRLEEDMGHPTRVDCGLHVHLNSDPRRGNAVNPVRLFENFQAVKEQHLYPFIAQGLNSRSYWAKPCFAHSFSSWVDDPERGELNPSNFLWGSGSKDTIEIRLGSATADPDKLEDWIRRIVALGAMSLYTEDETPLEVLAPHVDCRPALKRWGYADVDIQKARARGPLT